MVDLEKLADVVGHDEDSEYWKKEVSIVKDKRQFTIRIPKQFAQLAMIGDNNTFEFILIPVEKDGEKRFLLEGHLKKNGKR